MIWKFVYVGGMCVEWMWEGCGWQVGFWLDMEVGLGQKEGKGVDVVGEFGVDDYE